MRTNLLDLDLDGLGAFLGTLGHPATHAPRLMRFVHQLGRADFGNLPEVSRDLRDKLVEAACVTEPTIVSAQIATDGTHKWLFDVGDGARVETVFIPTDDRGTLCISSQVGCALKCTFCATGRQGFTRNLRTSEMVGQLRGAMARLAEVAPEGPKVTNVVFMGMGEPLLNYDAVLRAARVFRSDHTYKLSRRRVTISTSGVAPAIARLNDDTEISLTVSLHAPTDALRDTLVPLNTRYPIAEVLKATRAYVAGEARRRVVIAYALLAGVNDSDAQAAALADLLVGLPCKVNLLPFNPFPGTQYTRPDPARIDAFAEVLRARGYATIVRTTRGEEIDAACGQLVGRVRRQS